MDKSSDAKFPPKGSSFPSLAYLARSLGFGKQSSSQTSATVKPIGGNSSQPDEPTMSAQHYLRSQDGHEGAETPKPPSKSDEKASASPLHNLRSHTPSSTPATLPQPASSTSARQSNRKPRTSSTLSTPARDLRRRVVPQERSAIGSSDHGIALRHSPSPPRETPAALERNPSSQASIVSVDLRQTLPAANAPDYALVRQTAVNKLSYLLVTCHRATEGQALQHLYAESFEDAASNELLDALLRSGIDQGHDESVREGQHVQRLTVGQRSDWDRRLALTRSSENNRESDLKHNQSMVGVVIPAAEGSTSPLSRREDAVIRRQNATHLDSQEAEPRLDTGREEYTAPGVVDVMEESSTLLPESGDKTESKQLSSTLQGNVPAVPSSLDAVAETDDQALSSVFEVKLPIRKPSSAPQDEVNATSNTELNANAAQPEPSRLTRQERRLKQKLRHQREMKSRESWDLDVRVGKSAPEKRKPPATELSTRITKRPNRRDRRGADASSKPIIAENAENRAPGNAVRKDTQKVQSNKTTNDISIEMRKGVRIPSKAASEIAAASVARSEARHRKLERRRQLRVERQTAVRTAQRNGAEIPRYGKKPLNAEKLAQKTARKERKRIAKAEAKIDGSAAAARREKFLAQKKARKIRRTAENIWMAADALAEKYGGQHDADVTMNSLDGGVPLHHE